MSLVVPASDFVSRIRYAGDRDMMGHLMEDPEVREVAEQYKSTGGDQAYQRHLLATGLRVTERILPTIVQLVEMIVEKFAPALYGALGIFLPLIAVNCSILGGALFMQERQYSSIGEATAFAFVSGIGLFLAIVAIAAIR